MCHPQYWHWGAPVTCAKAIKTSSYLASTDCVSPVALKDNTDYCWSIALAQAGHQIANKTECRPRRTSLQAETAAMRHQHNMSAGNAIA